MEHDFYAMYLEELKQISPCTRQEAQQLAQALTRNDQTAKDRLMEGMLHLSLELAKEYEGKGLPIGDLVQEANMGLILAVQTYSEGEFWDYTGEQIRKSVEAAIEEQSREVKVEEEMLARVNVLKKVSEVLVQELGREATAEELAERMKMTVDEIKDIMKLTLDAMSISGEQE